MERHSRNMLITIIIIIIIIIIIMAGMKEVDWKVCL